MRTLALFLIIFMAGCGKNNTTVKESTSENTKKEAPQTEDVKNNAPAGNSENNSGGIGDVKYNSMKVPSGIKYEGKVVTTAEWTDDNGSNIVFITETDEHSTDNEDGRGKELYGYHYVDSDKQLWKINDLIKDCPVDITLEYVPNSLSVTDINNNGIAESTFLYRLSCKGDVSPDDLKLMMHEDDTKYAVRGETMIEYNIDGKNTYEGGKGTPDAAFNNAPEGFKKYAMEQWEKFKIFRY